MSKQSSVEWLQIKLKQLANLNMGFDTLFEQAKAMHKKECKESYYESLLSNFQTFEHYYNETYGGNS